MFNRLTGWKSPSWGALSPLSHGSAGQARSAFCAGLGPRWRATGHTASRCSLCPAFLLFCLLRGLVKILSQNESTHEGSSKESRVGVSASQVRPTGWVPQTCPEESTRYQVKLQGQRAGRTRIGLQQGLPRNPSSMSSALVGTKPGWPRRRIILGVTVGFRGRRTALHWTWW